MAAQPETSGVQELIDRLSHEGVAEAAVIGLPHPRWGERPLLIVVPSDNQPPDQARLLEWMREKVVSWWLPDDVIFVKEIPHTATGKIAKTELRRLYGNHRLPERASEG